MPNSIIAAQGYTVRDFAKTPADIAHTCAKLRKIGYQALQISGFGPIAPEEMAKILKNEGLTCCATHTSFERMINEPDRVAEEHHILGCKHLAPGSLPAAYRDEGGPGYLRFARDASTVASKLAALGLTLSYHNHHFEFAKFDGKTGLQLIYDNAPNLCAELDTFWVQTGGGDPVAWLRCLKGRTPLLHLKDMVYLKDAMVMAEVGEGNLDWPAILAAAKDSNTQWYIVEQDTCQRDPFDSLAISLRNLHNLGLT
ncbi:MAG: sugar phosphate isomerase/epimerase [Phycisphaerae bacterium]